MTAARVLTRGDRTRRDPTVQVLGPSAYFTLGSKNKRRCFRGETMRFLFVFLLAGCAGSAPAPALAPEPQPQYRWENTLGPATRAQFDSDSAQCEKAALSAVGERVDRGVQIFGP